MKNITIIVAFVLVLSASYSVVRARGQECAGKIIKDICRDGGSCSQTCKDDCGCKGKCIGDDCCCSCSCDRESEAFTANIAFFLQNVRGYKSKPALSTTVNEDIGSIRICGVGTFYGINAANTTTAVTVTIATQSGTANEYSDYDPGTVPNQIAFSSSDAGTDKCFDVKVIDDDAVEGTENFMLKFDTNAKVTLTPRVLNVEIADNDEDNNI